jgi:hypothetical protein
MLWVLECAAKESLPVCLFGGSPELLDKLQARVCEIFPGLQIAAKIASKFCSVRIYPHVTLCGSTSLQLNGSCLREQAANTTPGKLRGVNDCASHSPVVFRA